MKTVYVKQKKQLSQLNQVHYPTKIGSIFTLLCAAAIGIAGLISSATLPVLSQTPNCVQGSYLRKYITGPELLDGPEPDQHSFVEVTWQAEFCIQGNQWQAIRDPVIQPLGAGDVLAIGLDLQAPRLFRNAIVYPGRVRKCVAGSAGYSGISFDGRGCYTLANVAIRASVVNNTVIYSLQMQPTRFNNLYWTDQVR